jgi:hypothetical protein
MEGSDLISSNVRVKEMWKYPMRKYCYVLVVRFEELIQTGFISIEIV